jgi:hypothetical protein
MDKLAIEEALTRLEQPSSDSDSSSGDSTAAAGAWQAPVQMTSPFGGRRAVVSVPAGAPGTQPGSASSLERKFKFVSGPGRGCFH